MTDKRRDAVLFDMDGTLCDVRGIRHLVVKDGAKRDFHAFHTASAGAPPHDWVVEAARAAHKEGLGVLIVTARRERYRRLTSMWLALHDVPSDDLLMRPDHDSRMDHLVKQDILARIRRRWNPVHAWDDQPGICELWEHEGIPFTLVPGWGEVITKGEDNG